VRVKRRRIASAVPTRIAVAYLIIWSYWWAMRSQRIGRVSAGAWLGEHAEDHPDALADTIGAEAAVTAWRRHLLRRKASPANVNQALAAVTLMYERGARLRIQVKRARVPRPGEPDALAQKQQGAVERAAGRRSTRDAAIIAVLLYAGARAEECARVDLDDAWPSPPAPAPSGCTARATRSARYRCRPSPANASPPGSASAAPSPARFGPASAAR
jgi:hypothetical protein